MAQAESEAVKQGGTAGDGAAMTPVCAGCGRPNPAWSGAVGPASARAALNRMQGLHRGVNNGRPKGASARGWAETEPLIARGLAYLTAPGLAALEESVARLSAMPDWPGLRAMADRIERAPSPAVIEGAMRSDFRREHWMTALDGPVRAVVLLAWLRRRRAMPSRYEFEHEIDPAGEELLVELRRAVRRGDAEAEARILDRVADARAQVWPDGEPPGAAYVDAWAAWRAEAAA